jgi:hypothetical protein
MPYLELWSTRDPVTRVRGVASGQGGWEQVTRTIHMAVFRFFNGTPLNFELMAAEVSGELAYTVSYEGSVASAEIGAE